MKTAQDIYTEYNIMPSLQLHQLRVAAVAKLICENFDTPVNTHDVVLACLFHDMGNIIKSDLSLFPEFRADKGIEYWERIKAEFIAKYGDDAHKANVKIAKAIPLPDHVVALIDGVGFSRLSDILASDSFELKIVEYSDTRVGPRGVLSIGDRLTEARKRYDARQKHKPYYETDYNFKKLSSAARELEKQIFVDSALKPEGVNDETIHPLIDELRKYPV